MICTDCGYANGYHGEDCPLPTPFWTDDRPGTVTRDRAPVSIDDYYRSEADPPDLFRYHQLDDEAA